jgi:hypothetical protein
MSLRPNRSRHTPSQSATPLLVSRRLALGLAGLLGAAAVPAVALVASAGTASAATAAQNTQSVTFGYSTGPQFWTVPAGVTQVEITAVGGAGGAGGTIYGGAGGPGGAGGLVATTEAVTAGQQLEVSVGSTGSNATYAGPNALGGVNNTNPFYDGGFGGGVARSEAGLSDLRREYGDRFDGEVADAADPRSQQAQWC